MLNMYCVGGGRERTAQIVTYIRTCVHAYMHTLQKFCFPSEGLAIPYFFHQLINYATFCLGSSVRIGYYKYHPAHIVEFGVSVTSKQQDLGHSAVGPWGRSCTLRVEFSCLARKGWRWGLLDAAATLLHCHLHRTGHASSG